MFNFQTFPFTEIFKLFSEKEKILFSKVVFLNFLTSLLEVAGILSIMPFIALLLDQSLIDKSYLLKYLLLNLANDDIQTFNLFMGISVLVMLVLGQTCKIVSQCITLRFILDFEKNLTVTILKGYLHQAYDWFSDKHSSEASGTILAEASNVVHVNAMSLMTLLSQSFVAIALATILLTYDFRVALIVALIIGGFYLVIFILLKRFVRYIGDRRFKINLYRFKLVDEVFSAIKEIKIRGLEVKYINDFSGEARHYAKYSLLAILIASVPKHIFELVAFGGIIGLILVKLGAENFVTILPTITLYAVAGYKLIPALQSIFHSVSQMNFSRPSVAHVLNELNRDSSDCAEQKTSDFVQSFKVEKISFQNVCYRYPRSDSDSISNLDLEVEDGDVIGIAGFTGSGKSTLVNMLLGLLIPTQGELKVNNEMLSKSNLSRFRDAVGYVPQEIYLKDASIVENIAFGIPLERVDLLKLGEVIKFAALDEFVSALPNGIHSGVGENGSKLSGGQKQRIGLARAIYRDPKVLVLDEATSALDNVTENQVMSNILSSKDIKIVFIVAHRLTTLKQSNKILVLDQGRRVCLDEISKLQESCEVFKSLSSLLH